MTSYLTYLMVETQQAELAERAQRDPPHHPARSEPHPPGRLRTRTARLLVGWAVRLDDRLQPAPNAVPSVARS
jgi:hypothetical protein